MARPGLGRRGSSLNPLSFLPSDLKSKTLALLLEAPGKSETLALLLEAPGKSKTLALLLEAPGSKSKSSQGHDDFPKVLLGSTRGAVTLVSQPHLLEQLLLNPR